MQVTLDRELEKLVAEEIRHGRFESAEVFLGIAVRQFMIAQKYGEAEANKLSTLREELLRADAQIDKGDCSEYDPDTLSELIEETRQEALRRLKEPSTESS